MKQRHVPRHLNSPDKGSPGLDIAFGEVLRTYRKARQWTQEDLAVMMDMERVYISQLERGIRRPSLGALFRFAKQFGVEPAEIVQEMQRVMKEQH